VWSGQTLHDEFGDAALCEALIARAATVNGRPQVEGFDTAEGSMDVLIETLLPPWAIVLVGVNAASLALARIGRNLGWEVSLVDHREAAPPPDGLAEGARHLCARPEQLAGRVGLDARSFAVVMTHNLERDIEYLRALLPAPLAYLGAIGSRQRAGKLLRGCEAAPPRVRAPAGLDLGSETPEEIALAIAAEILAVTTGRAGTPLSASSGPIH
jgi:xanthine/CO dehydrogenase XdhC/CoxF family maturation factor